MNDHRGNVAFLFIVFIIIYIGELIYCIYFKNYTMCLIVSGINLVGLFFFYDYQLFLKAFPGTSDSNAFYKVIIKIFGIVCFAVVITKLYVYRHDYNLSDFSISFPNDKGKLGYNKDKQNGYTYIQYENSDCIIVLHKYKYDSSKSHMENIKANANLNKTKLNNMTMEEYYNTKFINDKKDINGKEWEYFESTMDKEYYRIYTYANNDNFYVFESFNIKEDNKDYCIDKTEETFKSIKYK